MIRQPPQSPSLQEEEESLHDKTASPVSASRKLNQYLGEVPTPEPVTDKDSSNKNRSMINTSVAVERQQHNASQSAASDY